MKSHEVIGGAVKGPGVKAVARGLRVSPALVYKWCEAPGEGEGSGARNPLDRVAELYRLTGDRQVINWLCGRAGGFFTHNPPTDTRRTPGEQIFDQTRRMFGEFSELLEEISRSTEADPYIDAAEAEQIRRRWEDLKAVLEQFTVACEQGHYHVRK